MSVFQNIKHLKVAFLKKLCYFVSIIPHIA